MIITTVTKVTAELHYYQCKDPLVNYLVIVIKEHCCLSFLH